MNEFEHRGRKERHAQLKSTVAETDGAQQTSNSLRRNRTSVDTFIASLGYYSYHRQDMVSGHQARTRTLILPPDFSFCIFQFLAIRVLGMDHG